MSYLFCLLLIYDDEDSVELGWFKNRNVIKFEKIYYRLDIVEWENLPKKSELTVGCKGQFQRKFKKIVHKDTTSLAVELLAHGIHYQTKSYNQNQ